MQLPYRPAHSAWHHIPRGWLTAAFFMCVTSDGLFLTSFDQELLFSGTSRRTTDDAKLEHHSTFSHNLNSNKRIPTLKLCLLNPPDKIIVLNSEGLLLPCSDVCTCYQDWMNISRMLMTFSFQCSNRAEIILNEALCLSCHIPPSLPCADLLLYICDICCDLQNVFLITY